jgi:hypothetical protein
LRIAVVAAALTLFGGAHRLDAQTQQRTGQSLLQQQRTIDEKLDQQRKELAPLDTFSDWQWGGWLEYYIFHFQDGVQSQRVFQRPGLVLWTRLNLDGGAHQIFARMRLTFEYYNPGDEYVRQQDWVGPNLDRGWYQIDVGRALRLTEPADPFQLRVRTGRQEVQLGTGYTLDMPLDAVTIDTQVYDFRVIGLIGKTIASYPNIDRSLPVYDHSNRHFLGVQIQYEGLQNHRPFVYALWNNDRTDERPKNPYQNYSYDTRYFGVGSRGSLAHNLNYWTEWVFEAGRSYGDGQIREQDKVHAWGWDVGIEYLWDRPMHPFVVGEYMFASGDSGRLFSPTNAAGGNRGDSRDTSFVGFGYRDTGIAAAPTRSNIHIWRAGGGLKPLEQVEFCRELEVGTDWFLYHKHHRRGAISDPTAQQFSGYVGWEMDYYINWRFASDLSWTIRWGAFFPGDAFQDRSMRNFLFTGVTWSF